MASWFGSGRLSEITGQISNFTKEVITEGTEEVDDHATELRIAKSRLAEYNTICLTQKAELERVQGVNEDLADKLESSELQINAVSNEYRDLLKCKESEIQELKHRQSELQDLQSQMLVSASQSELSHSPSGSSMVHSSSAPLLHAVLGLGGEEHDLDDVISSQHEINRLRCEVQQLDAQCRHWREACSASQGSDRAGVKDGPAESTVTLQTQLKELQQQLTDEIDQHQRERAALQDVHAQKLSTLKKRHREEVSRLQEDSTRRHQATDGSTGEAGSDVSSLQDKVKHLDKVNHKLSVDLEHTHAADREKAHTIEQLHTQLDALGKQKQQLEQQKSGWAAERLELMEDMEARAEERQGLKQQLGEMSRQLVDRDQQLQMLQDAEAAHDSTAQQQHTLDLSGYVTATSTPVAPGKRPAKSVTFSVQDVADSPDASSSELNEQVVDLTAQLSKYRQESEHFDLVKSDWLMEKEALEDVLLRLREQLRQAEEALDAAQAPGGDAETSRVQTAQLKHNEEEIEADLDELTQQVELLTEGNSQLESERNHLAEEKEQLASEAQQHKASVVLLEEQVQQHKAQVQVQLRQLQDAASEVERLRSTVQESTAGWETKVQELKHQVADQAAELEHSTAQLDTQRHIDDDLQQRLQARDHQEEEEEEEEEEVEVEEDEQQQQQQQQQQAEAASLRAEVSSKDADIHELSMSLEEKEGAVLRLQEDKATLETGLEELDAQHQEALGRVLADRAQLHTSNEQLNKQLCALQEQLETHTAHTPQTPSLQHSPPATGPGDTSSPDHGQTNRLAAENTHLAQRNQEAALALNNLHMDKKELQERVDKLTAEGSELQDNVKQLNEERNELAQRCNQLKQDLTEQNTELVQHREQGEKLSLQEDSRRLEVEKREDEEESQVMKQQRQMEELQQQLLDGRELSQQLSTQLQQLQQDKDSLATTQQAADRSWQDQVHRLNTHNQQLQQQMDTLRQTTLEERTQQEQRLKQLEDDKDAATQCSQKEHERLLGLCREKDVQISNVEVLCDQFQAEIAETKLLLQSSVDDQHLGQTESSSIAENASLKDLCIKEGKHVQELQAELVGLAEEFKYSQRDNTNLTAHIQQLQTRGESSVAGDGSPNAHPHPGAASEQQLYICDTKTREKQLTRKDKDDSQTTVQPDSLHEDQPMKEAAAADRCTTGNRMLENGDIDCDIDNQHSASSAAELQRLRKVVDQKEDVIAQMRDNNLALLKLVEDKSLVLQGDRTLVDVQRLEGELRSLRMEKEQMMAVLNEKTRECSSLKSEVHRLMNVVSAEKTAISKLQQDNEAMVKRHVHEEPPPNADMTKEAVKRLSQIIRDKDLEIEALNQKNQTLLLVLQDCSMPGGAGAGAAAEAADGGATSGVHISTLMQERDNLTKQVAIFQKDRENIISALNGKHQESMAYHAEIQRLNAIVATETEKQDKLQQAHSSLVQQYEDKQQCLLKVQNELLNYKQKYADLVNDNYKRQTARNNTLSASSSKNSPSHTRVPSLSLALPADSNSQVVNGTMQLNSSCTAEVAQELEDLKTIISSHEEAFVEKDKIIQGREQLIRERERTLADKDRVLSDKDKHLSQLNSRLHQLEESMHGKDSELSANRKQCEHLNFQLQGLSSEARDLQQERDQLLQQNAVLRQEISVVADTNNRLTMSINDKDFEMKALKEKVNTLSQLLQEHGEKGEVEQLMRETELVQQQAQSFKQERDHMHLALQQAQGDSQHLRNEMQRLQEREQKLVQEVERLRGHLLQVEEGYTQEALDAEEREKQLRTRLVSAEDKALSSSSAVLTASQHALQQVDSLQMQLHALAEQRDNALMQLAGAQETANQYATSLANLQMVLEQFQLEKESQQATEIERYQRDLAHYKENNRQLKDQARQMKAEVDETKDALEAAHRLSEQLDRKEEMVAALREEVQLREQQLSRAEDELNKVTSSTEAKVDKVLVKNLILGYLHAPKAKRPETLQLIGRVLTFSQDEMQELSMDGSGWLSSLFKRATPTPPTTPKKTTAAGANGSFSELFVHFLEKESTPPPQMHLPAERMVAEQQQRHQQQHRKPPPAFNPFTAPMHATLPLQVDTRDRAAVDSSHLLMKPMTSSVSLFAPMSAPSGAIPVAPSGSGSGRGSANSSGRSTPASSGAILRDVLQQ